MGDQPSFHRVPRSNNSTHTLPLPPPIHTPPTHTRPSASGDEHNTTIFFDRKSRMNHSMFMQGYLRKRTHHPTHARPTPAYTHAHTNRKYNPEVVALCFSRNPPFELCEELHLAATPPSFLHWTLLSSADRFGTQVGTSPNPRPPTHTHTHTHLPEPRLLSHHLTTRRPNQSKNTMPPRARCS